MAWPWQVDTPQLFLVAGRAGGTACGVRGAAALERSLHGMFVELFVTWQGAGRAAERRGNEPHRRLRVMHPLGVVEGQTRSDLWF